MDKRTLWAERVAGWKASGLTSSKYCKGKPFSDGGLRYWASRLRKEKGQDSPAPVVPMAKVVRRRSAQDQPALGGKPLDSTNRSPSNASDALVLECGTMRLAIRAGFDRDTLAAVLDLLASQGGAR